MDNERLKKEVVTLKLQLADRSAEQSNHNDRHAFEEEMDRLREEVQLLRKQVGHHTPFNHSGSHGRDRHWQPQPQPQPPLPTHQHSGTPTTVNPRILTPEPSLPRENRTLVACPICPDPDPDCPCQQVQSGAASSPGSAIQLPRIREAAQTTMVPPPSTCGLCQSTEECLCRAVDEAEAEAGAQGEVEGIDIKPILPPSHLDDRSPVDDSCGLCTGGEFCACKAVASNNSSTLTVGAVASATPVAVAQSPSSSSSSAALPLRLRVRGTLKTSIWALDNPTATPTPTPTPTLNASASVPVDSRPTLVRNASASRSEAVCSGDPSNCDACRNDSFGMSMSPSTPS
jgi:AP-1-like factor